MRPTHRASKPVIFAIVIAGGMLVQPAHDAARAADIRRAARSQTARANPESARKPGEPPRKKAIPSPERGATPAVLAADGASAKAGQSPKARCDTGGGAPLMARMLPTAAVHGIAAHDRAPRRHERLHRPTHFAHAPPRA